MTGFIGDSLSGSWFSIALKRAGWDGVVIHGTSEEWINVFIDDDRIEFRDATSLLGKGTFETEELIREELGDDQVRSATIGHAGENMVRYANVTNDGRQAGRTGHGAVWGDESGVGIEGHKILPQGKGDLQESDKSHPKGKRLWGDPPDVSNDIRFAGSLGCQSHPWASQR